MMASILKIVITRNTICDNLVGFPKSGHIIIIAVTFILTFILNSYTQATRQSASVIKVYVMFVGTCIMRCWKEELA